MTWVVSFPILSRFGPRGRLDAMFMGRGDGVEVDAGAAMTRDMVCTQALPERRRLRS